MSLEAKPLATLSPAEVRQKLAGLLDDQSSSESLIAAYMEQAVAFCAALPQVYGSTLDRMKLWEKIESAIRAAYAKTVSGDIDLFVQSVLESLQADVSVAVGSERFGAAYASLVEMDREQGQQWMRFMVSRLIPVLVHARNRHKQMLGGDE